MLDAGTLRVRRVGQDVAAADGVVPPEQNIAFPFADEHAFGRPALVAGVIIDRPPALGAPAHDFDVALRWIVYQRPISFERRVGSRSHRHARPRQPERQIGVEIVDRHRYADARL